MTTHPDMTMVEVVARVICPDAWHETEYDAWHETEYADGRRFTLVLWEEEQARARRMARAAIAAIKRPWPCSAEADGIIAMAQSIEAQIQRMTSDTSKACRAHMVMMANSTTFRAAYEAFLDAALKEE